jgi:hypothetical protein
MELDNIVEKYKDKELFEIITELQREVSRLKSTKGRAEKFNDYINSAREVLFFLQSGVKPSGLTSFEFNKIKPMVEKLVEKGNLKKEILDYFE